MYAMGTQVELKGSWPSPQLGLVAVARERKVRRERVRYRTFFIV
jgi:hypothetical protein